MHYFKSRYFKKILIILLVISFVPLIILSFSVARILILEKEMIQSMQESTIQRQKEEVESILRNIEHSVNRSILKSLYIQSLELPRSAENFQLFGKIEEELKSLESPEINIEDIVLVSNVKDWVMTFKEFTSLDQSSYKNLVKEIKASKQPVLWMNVEGFIYYVRQIPINVISGKGILIIKLKTNTLQKKIEANNLPCSIVITDEEQQLIIGSEDDYLIWSSVSNDTEKFEDLQQERVFQSNYKKESYAIVGAKSDYNGWQYTAISKNSEINGHYILIYRLLIMMITGLVLFGIGYSVYYSFRIFAPMNEINNLVDKNLGVIQQPKLDQFDITAKVNSILCDNASMRKQITKHSKLVQKRFLTDLYMGDLIEVDKNSLVDYQLMQECPDEINYYIMAIRFCDFMVDKKEQKLFLFAINNIIEEILSTIDVFPAVVIGDILYLTYYETARSMQGMEIKLKKISEMLIEASNQYLKKSINVGVSARFTNVNEFPNAMNQSNQMLQKSMNQFDSCIIYDTYKGNLTVSVNFKLKQKRMILMNELMNSQELISKEKLDKYLKLVLEQDYYLIKLELSKLVADLLDYCNDYSVVLDNMKVKEIVELDIYSPLNTQEILKDFLWDNFFVPLIDQLSQPIEDANISLQIINYINNHIESDLSLDDCAMKFNYNPNYLSRMFKKNFNKTFTEYVTEKKLEQCKTLLLMSEFSVNEIAEKMGYNSSQNFIRVFKKYELMTPGQFRSVNNVLKTYNSK